MKKILSTALILSMLAPHVASAQESSEKKDEDSSLPPVVYPINRGQIAPYSGVLFSQAAAASVVADRQTLQDRIDLAVRNAVEVVTAQKDFDYRQLSIKCVSDVKTKEAELTSASLKLKKLEDDLRDAEKKRLAAEEIASSRPTWTSIGFASGVVLTVVTVFAVSQASK